MLRLAYRAPQPDNLAYVSDFLLYTIVPMVEECFGPLALGIRVVTGMAMVVDLCA